MTAYLVAQLTVSDPESFEAYRAVVPAVIAHYGGRYLVRGGAIEELEGKLPQQRLVIIAFPDMAVARRFYQLPDYQEILPLRLAAAEGTVALVEGVPEN